MNEQAIFIAALQEEPANRTSYLERACGADESLRQRVEKLLAAYERAGSFLDNPAAAVSSPAADVTSAGRTATYGIDAAATANFPGKDEAVGTVIAGKYKLIEEIGEGGMGSVYMAQQTEPVKRAVAKSTAKRRPNR